MKLRNPILLLVVLAIAAVVPSRLGAAIPDALPYQGRVSVGGVNFSGTGHFKFAVYQHATGIFTPAGVSSTISGGSVSGIAVLSGGSGYSDSVTVRISGGGGSGATATATVVNGTIITINIDNPGSGYIRRPEVFFTDPAAPVLLWDNPGAITGILAEPAAAVSLPVTNGLYVVGLGDTVLNNMAPLPASLAPAGGLRVFVRVWFSDGVNGFQQLSPDTELRSVPFAREAISALTAANLGGVPLANLARLDAANTFSNPNGLAIAGPGPQTNYWPNQPASGTSVPITGAGARMEFVPGYGAFRSGSVTGTQWDASSIGPYSVAMGYNTIASSTAAIALGYNTTASDYGATAMGLNTVASGSCSIASGYTSTASGYASTALGDHTQSTGYGSTALGVWAAARGTFATSLGLATTAESFGETVLGCYDTNYTPTGLDTWSAADRLFVIGNGTSDDARSDALSLYKNAVFTVQGNGPVANVPAADATVPVSGPGTRMLFLPGYSAFRAGTVTGTLGNVPSGEAWDAANIGDYSAAMGLNTTASGACSTALGSSTTASNSGSTAMGIGAVASQYASTAMGHNTAASQYASTAMGEGTTASGSASTAMGYGTIASCYASTAMGYGTTASSYGETVLGRYNTEAATPNPNSWVSSDRLFVIGNGTLSTARSDALIVYKNGNATLKGDLSAKSFITTSDRALKIDIVAADTASVLAKVAALPVATWKFKDETVTHLGPMAQDFFAAFQLGGTDTGIASVDTAGVALAAIQELKKQLDAKDACISALEARLLAIEAKLAIKP